MNRKFIHAIILTKEEARNFYKLLKDVECSMPVTYCPFCSSFLACHEFRNILKALEDYIDKREEE